MRIERRYTKTSGFPYAEIEFRSAKSEIRNPDGSVVFALENFEVPAVGARWRLTSWPKNTSARPVFRRA